MQKAAAQRSPRIRDKGVNMILAEKIINMRKKAGWSQEELAEQLGVSRQSVSKWESSQSVPDMDKIVRMSDIFSVSTDFLLKDELSMDDQIPQVQSSEPGLRRVSMEEASEFMDLRAKAAPFFALNTLLCVASPVLLILLGGLSEVSEKLSENVAVGTGLCALIIMVAIAVMGFIKCSSPSSRYSFLEKEPFETEYGVTGLVRKRKDEFLETYTRVNSICTVICILSVLPLFVAIIMNASDFMYIVSVCIILTLVSIATYGFVRVGIVMASYDKLLEEGDYTKENKAHAGDSAGFSTVYWLVATAAFLIMNFTGVSKAWIIWPVAGVLFAAIRIIFNAVRKK